MIVSVRIWIQIDLLNYLLLNELILELNHLISKACQYYLNGYIFYFILLINYRYDNGVVTCKHWNCWKLDCISYKWIQYQEHQCSSDCKRCCWKHKSISTCCSNPCWLFLWLILSCLCFFLCCFAGNLYLSNLNLYIYIMLGRICKHFVLLLSLLK